MVEENYLSDEVVAVECLDYLDNDLLVTEAENFSGGEWKTGVQKP